MIDNLIPLSRVIHNLFIHYVFLLFDLTEVSPLITHFPHFGNMLGGTGVTVFFRVFRLGRDDDIECVFDEQTEEGIYISRIRALCIVPVIHKTGSIPFNLRIKRDSELIATYSSTFTIRKFQTHETSPQLRSGYLIISKVFILTDLYYGQIIYIVAFSPLLLALFPHPFTYCKHSENKMAMEIMVEALFLLCCLHFSQFPLIEPMLLNLNQKIFSSLPVKE